MRFVLHGGAAVAAVCLTGCAVTLDSQSQISREEKRFAVAGATDVTVTTFDGSIRSPSVGQAGSRSSRSRSAAATRRVDAAGGESRTAPATGRRDRGAEAEAEIVGGSVSHGRSARLIVTVPAARRRRGEERRRVDQSSGVAAACDLRSGDGSIGPPTSRGDGADTGDGSNDDRKRRRDSQYRHWGRRHQRHGAAAGS